MEDKVRIYKVLAVLQLADCVLPHLLADLDILLKVGVALDRTQSGDRFLWIDLVVLLSLHFLLRAVFAAFLNAFAVGAPLLPGLRMRSLEPALMRFRLACMFL